MSHQLSPSERVAIARLHALLELLPTALDQRLRPAGITGFEFTLLENLAEADGGYLRLSELARKTNATLPRLSRVASSLERRGLAERATCPEDARATNLVITPAGTQTYRHARDLYADAVRKLIFDGLVGLPGDGVEQLTTVAHAILSTLDPAAPATTECAADPALVS